MDYATKCPDLTCPDLCRVNSYSTSCPKTTVTLPCVCIQHIGRCPEPTHYSTTCLNPTFQYAVSIVAQDALISLPTIFLNFLLNIAFMDYAAKCPDLTCLELYKSNNHSTTCAKPTVILPCICIQHIGKCPDPTHYSTTCLNPTFQYAVSIVAQDAFISLPTIFLNFLLNIAFMDYAAKCCHHEVALVATFCGKRNATSRANWHSHQENPR